MLENSLNRLFKKINNKANYISDFSKIVIIENNPL